MVVSNKGMIFGPMRKRSKDKEEYSILDELPNRIKEAIRGQVDSNVSVEPKRGAVVYCDLARDYAEHSGIYVGNGQIVNLEGDGKITKVTFEEFIRLTIRLGNYKDIKVRTAKMIYVSCRNGKSVGSDEVADRALSMVGKTKEYSLLMNNCHQFTASCLSGDFKSPVNSLWMLKGQAFMDYDANQWFRCYGEPKKKSFLSAIVDPIKY